MQAAYASANAWLDGLALRGGAHAALAVSGVQLPLVRGAGMGAVTAGDGRARRLSGGVLASISLEEYAVCVHASLLP